MHPRLSNKREMMGAVTTPEKSLKLLSDCMGQQ
jgi:hypothetical protein